VILIDAASGFRDFGPMGALADLLCSDFTVFTYDRRGRGESSDTAPYAVDREVEDIAALIEAAGGAAFIHGFSSGAVLALHAIAAGLPIEKASLLEPPIELNGEPDTDPQLQKELGELITAGRRGDAVEHFNKAIGVPEEMVAGMRHQPFWPKLESIAHTLAYDLNITGSFPARRVSEIKIPVLVVDSDQSDVRLHTWAEQLAHALPNAAHRRLPGGWHGVEAEVLAPELMRFFAERANA
jgi:pimeloyl-ACP methyl ester carboxylesterase